MNSLNIRRQCRSKRISLQMEIKVTNIKKEGFASGFPVEEKAFGSRSNLKQEGEKIKYCGGRSGTTAAAKGRRHSATYKRKKRRVKPLEPPSIDLNAIESLEKTKKEEEKMWRCKIKGAI